MEQQRPIIIRRGGEDQRHGHHGGAWKVAYADFVTAMMAFFLLLWLVSSANQATLRGLAEFFSDATVHTGPPGGAGGVLEGFSIMPLPLPPTPGTLSGSPAVMAGAPSMSQGRPLAPTEDEIELLEQGSLAEANPEEGAELEAAKATLLAMLEAAPELWRIKDNLMIDRTPEGLRIQLIDRDQLAMFPVGSDAMYPHTRRLLEVVVSALATVSGRLSIRGHTDALPFAPGAGYDNWSLSSDRADATRRVMLEAGLDPSRIAEIVGKGDAEPLVPGQADDPRNRRISIVLLREDGASGAPHATSPAWTGGQP
jgi:chemotaxis protein MotB